MRVSILRHVSPPIAFTGRTREITYSWWYSTSKLLIDCLRNLFITFAQQNTHFTIHKYYACNCTVLVHYVSYDNNAAPNASSEDTLNHPYYQIFCKMSKKHSRSHSFSSSINISTVDSSSSGSAASIVSCLLSSKIGSSGSFRISRQISESLGAKTVTPGRYAAGMVM